MVVRVVVAECAAPNSLFAAQHINAVDAFTQDLLDAGRVALDDIGAGSRT